MPKPKGKDVYKRNISVSGVEFNIEEIYKGIKELAAELGYGFVEKEYEDKPEQYGHKMGFKFIMSKDIDPLANFTIEVETAFRKLTKLKTTYIGDCSVKIKATLTTDYKNNYGQDKMSIFFFKLYSKVAGGTLKKKYIIPLSKEGGEVYSYFKKKLDLY